MSICRGVMLVHSSGVGERQTNRRPDLVPPSVAVQMIFEFRNVLGCIQHIELERRRFCRERQFGRVERPRSWTGATLVYVRVSKKGEVQRAVAYLWVSAKGLERVGALVEQRQALTQTIVSVWGLSRGCKLRPQNR